MDRTREEVSPEIAGDLEEAEMTIKEIGQHILAVLIEGDDETGTTTPEYNDIEILIWLRELETGGTTTTEEVINGDLQE